jgi:hypothetical protein
MTTVANKYRGTKEYFLVHAELLMAARYRGTISYGDVGRILGIRQPGGRLARESGQILGEISEDEILAGRPMLSALAVTATSRKPSDGFFGLAASFGLLPNNTNAGKELFWRKTLGDLYQLWRVE